MSKEKGLMVVDDRFSVLDFFFLFDQFWIFCLIHGFWGDGGLMMVAEWVDGGGWVGVYWFEDEYFIWINVCDRKIDMGVLKK